MVGIGWDAMSNQLMKITIGQAAARLRVTPDRMIKFVEDNKIEIIKKYNYPDQINFVELKEKWNAQK